MVVTALGTPKTPPLSRLEYSLLGGCRVSTPMTSGLTWLPDETTTMLAGLVSSVR